MGNLRRSKIRRLSILHYTPLAKCQQPQHLLPPPPNWPSDRGFGYYMRSYMKYMLSKCVQNKYRKPYNEKEKFKFWGKNGLKFKLKHRKAQKSILCRRFGDPYGRAGGQCRFRESWHICSLSVELGFSIPFVGADSGFLVLNSGFQSSGFLDSTRKTLLNSGFQVKNFPTIEIQVTLHVHRASSS